MKNRFETVWNSDSPAMLRLSQLGSLILLNVLWLVCSLPVITLGPATTAMHYVTLQLLTGGTDSVVKPFFHAFRRDFRQSLLLGIPMTLLYFLLGFNALYIHGLHPEGFHPLWIPYLLLALMVAAVTVCGFPMLARYACSLRQVVQNSLLICAKEPKFFGKAAVFTFLPLALALLLPEFFLKISFFWAAIGVSLTAWMNDKALLGIFQSVQEE